MPELNFNADALTVGTSIWFVSESIIEEPYDGTEYYVSHGVISKVENMPSRYVSQQIYRVTFGDNIILTYYFGFMEFYNPHCYLTEAEAIAAVEITHADHLRYAEEELADIRKRVRYMKKRVGAPVIRVSLQINVDHGRYFENLKNAIKEGTEHVS